MRYIAIWFAVFAGAVLIAGLLAALVFAGQFVVEQNLWWVPAALGIAVMIATLAVSLEYLTDHPEESGDR